MNTIYLRRRRRVHINEGDEHLPITHLAAMLENVKSLGFGFSQELIERLRTLSAARAVVFYKSLIKALREIVGAHREFRPMYPNFPEQVMAASEAELYLNAWLHYLTEKLPGYDKHERPNLTEPTQVRVIELGSREEFEGIFSSLVSARTPLSTQDKEDVVWFVSQYRNAIAPMLPLEIPIKETLAVIGAQLLRHTSLAERFLTGKIKTATDVLRLAVALSDGDVSLAEPTEFGRFRRTERVQMLSWLDRCPDPTEDMLRWKERWKRLGERLHPGEYASRFPKSAAAFSIIRNEGDFATFNSQIESHFRHGNLAAALELLSGRPGDLTRRLDHLLRLGGDAALVLSAFARVSSRVSTPVLLQTLTHFSHRTERTPWRVFFPKGDVAKVQAIPNRMQALALGVPEQVTSICRETLVERFRKLPPLGKCFVDPLLMNYLVPFSQRSAAKALRTLVRGSRLPMPASNCVRFFIWWKNGSSRTDIDLSAALFDENYKYVDVVSYYNLKNFGGHHSGDIVDAPRGAAEFIDLDIARTMAVGVRFVVMSLNSFTEQPYCDLPECFAGWMERSCPNSGEIFEARTVQDRIDVSANTRICIPLILDLVKRQVIWTDIALRKHPCFNNVANNLSGVSLMLRAMDSLVRMNLHTLFSLHVAGRGEFVDQAQQAEAVFSVEQGVTPFDVDRIASEFM